MHLGGITSEKLKPEADTELAKTHCMAISQLLLSASSMYIADATVDMTANIIARATSSAAELAKDEFDAGVPALLQDLLEYRPR